MGIQLSVTFLLICALLSGTGEAVHMRVKFSNGKSVEMNSKYDGTDSTHYALATATINYRTDISAIHIQYAGSACKARSLFHLPGYYSKDAGTWNTGCMINCAYRDLNPKNANSVIFNKKVQLVFLFSCSPSSGSYSKKKYAYYKLSTNYKCYDSNNKLVPKGAFSKVTNTIADSLTSTVKTTVSFSFVAKVAKSDQCAVAKCVIYVDEANSGNYACAQTVASGKSQTTSKAFSLAPGDHKTWIKVMASDGTGQTSSKTTFCVSAYADVPQPTYPVGTTLEYDKVSAPTIKFKWKGIDDWGYLCDTSAGTGKNYVVKLGGTSVQPDSNKTSVSITLPTLNVGKTTFSWTVQSKVGNLIRSVTASKFVTCVTGQPGTATASSPSGDVSSGATVTFTWSLANWGETCSVAASDLKIELYVQENGKAAVRQGTYGYNVRTAILDLEALKLPVTKTLSWYINAVGARGNNRASGSKAFRLCDLPVSPVTNFGRVLPSGTSVTCESGTSEMFEFGWTGPSSWGGTCSSTKKVEVLMNGGSWTETTGTTARKAISCATQTLTFTARAYNGRVYSTNNPSLSVEMCALVHCAKVTGLSAKGPVSDVVRGKPMILSWSGTDFGNSCDDSPKEYVLSVTDGTGKVSTHAVSSTSLELTATTSGTYKWQVTAKKGTRVSPVSDVHSFGVCELSPLGKISNLVTEWTNSAKTKAKFTWNNPTNIKNLKKQCGIDIAYTTNIYWHLAGENSWSLLKSVTTSTSVTQSTTYTFDTADQNIVWKIEIVNDQGIQKVVSYDKAFGACDVSAPTWPSPSVVKPDNQAIIVGDVEFVWNHVEFGPLCGDEAMQNYTVIVDGEVVGSDVEHGVVTATRTVDSGSHTWHIRANNELAGTASEVRQLCIADVAPASEIVQPDAKQNTPFNLSWTAGEWGSVCSQTATVVLVAEQGGIERELSAEKDARGLVVKEGMVPNGEHNVRVVYSVVLGDGSVLTRQVSETVSVEVCNTPDVELAEIVAPDDTDYILCENETVGVAWSHVVPAETACLDNETIVFTAVLKGVDGDVLDTVETTDTAQQFQVEQYGQYTVEVTAANVLKQSGVAARAFECCTPRIEKLVPTQPQNETLFINQKDVVLEWERLNITWCNNEARAYVVYWEEAGDERWVEVSVDATALTVENVSLPGQVWWRVEAEQNRSGFGERAYASENMTFVTCLTTPPTEITLRAPTDGCTVSSYESVELAWEMTGTGELCGQELAASYKVYVWEGEERDETAGPVAEVDDGKTGTVVGGLQDGATYHWSVVGENGRAEGKKESAAGTFTFCQKTRPNVPGLYKPFDGGAWKVREKPAFEIAYDEAPFGEECTHRVDGVKPRYEVLVYDVRSAADPVYRQKLLDEERDAHWKNSTEGTWVYRFDALEMEWGTYTWYVRGVNSQGEYSEGGPYTVVVCDEPLEVEAWVKGKRNTTKTRSVFVTRNTTDDEEENTQTDEYDDLGIETTIEWTPLTAKEYGVPCMDGKPSAPGIYMEVYRVGVAVPDSSSAEESDSEDVMDLRVDEEDNNDDEIEVETDEIFETRLDPRPGFTSLFIGSDVFKEPATTYVIRVIATNGFDTRPSKPIEIRTPDAYCGNWLVCGEHGTCIEGTRECDCEDGWEGELCEQEKGATEVNVGMYAGIGVGVFAVIVGLIVGALLIRRRRRRTYDNGLNELGVEKEKRFAFVRRDVFEDADERFGYVVDLKRAGRVDRKAAMELVVNVEEDIDGAFAVKFLCNASTAWLSEEMKAVCYMYAAHGSVEAVMNNLLVTLLLEADDAVAVVLAVNPFTLLFKHYARMHCLEYLSVAVKGTVLRVVRDRSLNDEPKKERRKQRRKERQRAGDEDEEEDGDDVLLEHFDANMTVTLHPDPEMVPMENVLICLDVVDVQTVLAVAEEVIGGLVQCDASLPSCVLDALRGFVGLIVEQFDQEQSMMAWMMLFLTRTILPALFNPESYFPEFRGDRLYVSQKLQYTMLVVCYVLRNAVLGVGFPSGISADILNDFAAQHIEILRGCLTKAMTMPPNVDIGDQVDVPKTLLQHCYSVVYTLL